jgi:hypothetical protein
MQIHKMLSHKGGGLCYFAKSQGRKNRENEASKLYLTLRDIKEKANLEKIRKELADASSFIY